MFSGWCAFKVLVWFHNYYLKKCWYCNIIIFVCLASIHNTLYVEIQGVVNTGQMSDRFVCLFVCPVFTTPCISRYTALSSGLISSSFPIMATGWPTSAITALVRYLLCPSLCKTSPTRLSRCVPECSSVSATEANKPFDYDWRSIYRSMISMFALVYAKPTDVLTHALFAET